MRLAVGMEVDVWAEQPSEIPSANRPCSSARALALQHSATNETVSPARNVIVEMTLQPPSIASRHPSLLQ